MTTEKKQSKVPAISHGEILQFKDDEGWIARGHLSFDELVFALAYSDEFRDGPGDWMGYDLFGEGVPNDYEWPALAEFYLADRRIVREYGRRLAALPNDDYGWYYWPAKQGQRGATAYTLIWPSYEMA